ncbi:PH domain-containing protein [bacterium]|nr:PH domain-containing protein [bacterium]
MAVNKQIVDEQIKALEGTFDTFGTKKEIEYLPEILNPEETIHALASGMLRGTTWLLIVTDKRVIFVDKKMVGGLEQVDFPLSRISGVQHKQGNIKGEITLTVEGVEQSILNVSNKYVTKVAGVISDLLDERFDVAGQIEKLADLVSRELLTEEEFLTRKKKLLDKDV